MLGFNPNVEEQQFIRHWQGDHLVEMVSFTIAAGVKDSKDGGLGRYLNRVEEALKNFAAELALDKSRQELIVRFHQHISYQCPELLIRFVTVSPIKVIIYSEPRGSAIFEANLSLCISFH